MRVFGGFLIFAAVIVALLWVFQVALLGAFYKQIKIGEIQKSAEAIETAIEDPNLPVYSRELSERYELDLLITSERGVPLLISYYTETNAIFRGTPAQYREIYEETKAAGGSIFQPYARLGDSQSPRGEADNNMILSKAVHTASGQNFLLLLHSNLTPVDATRSTLEFQLYCITFILIFLSVVLALILTAMITRPITKINETARALGEGNYNVRFDESGYREVSELAGTMNYTVEELSKLESLRRELIANISHDLRTPLTMIEGYSEVMRDIPGENTPENIQVILDESHRLSSLVSDMLDLSKLQSGSMPLEEEVFCITEEIGELISRYSKFSENEIRFEQDCDLYVQADKLKISQVVYNLINNAAVHSGSVDPITVRQSVKNDTVRIEVIDHGRGIDPAQLSEIWERYYKADRTQKKGEGSGLGLSIVKAILDLHKATYGVESKPGAGSNFWFELPTVASGILGPADGGTQGSPVG